MMSNVNEFQDKETVIKIVGTLERKTEEDDVKYYKRIFQKKPNESEEKFEQRVKVIKEHSPELPVWKNDVYKNYVTVVESNEYDQEKVVTTTTTKKTKKQSPTKTVPKVINVSLCTQTYFNTIRSMTCKLPSNITIVVYMRKTKQYQHLLDSSYTIYVNVSCQTHFEYSSLS